MMKKLTKLELVKQYSTEAELMKKAKEFLEVQPDVQLIRINDRFAKGYSDLFLNVNGHFVALELKDDTGKPTPHQILFMRNVVGHGGIGGVCRTLADISKYLEEARQRGRHR